MSDLSNELLHDRLTLATPEVRSEYLWPAMAEEILTLRARIQAVRDLHAPGAFVFSWRDRESHFEPRCEKCLGKAGVHECGCWADEDQEWKCKECGPKSSWPCPTIRALDGDQ